MEMGSSHTKTGLTSGLGEEIYRQNLGNCLQGVAASLCLVDGEEIGQFRNQTSSSNWSGIHRFMLSPKLPSSTWIGALDSYRKTQTSASDCYVYSLRKYQEERGLCSIATLLILSAFPHIYLSPRSNGLNLPFGTQGVSKKLEAFFLQRRNRTWEGIYTQEDPILLGYTNCSPSLTYIYV